MHTTYQYFIIKIKDLQRHHRDVHRVFPNQIEVAGQQEHAFERHADIMYRLLNKLPSNR